jgi:hypothetical protein
MLERVEHLGQITVEFWRVNILQKVENPRGHLWNEEKGKIPEKALKGKAISRKAGSVTSREAIKFPRLKMMLVLIPPRSWLQIQRAGTAPRLIYWKTHSQRSVSATALSVGLLFASALSQCHCVLGHVAYY